MEETFVPRGLEKAEDFDRRRAQVSAAEFMGTCPVNISCKGQRDHSLSVGAKRP